jgi:hypothetical protein
LEFLDVLPPASVVSGLCRGRKQAKNYLLRTDGSLYRISTTALLNLLNMATCECLSQSSSLPHNQERGHSGFAICCFV